jgi:hypothetical protein
MAIQEDGNKSTSYKEGIQLPNNACIPFAMNAVFVTKMNTKIEILMFKNGKIKTT